MPSQRPAALIRSARRPSALLLATFAVACAGTGTTYRSGVGDTYLDHAPWYAGARAIPAAGLAGGIGHLPITFQRGATQPDIFDPADAPIGTLLDEMNAYLDALAATAPIGAGSRPVGTPPDVQFGCERYAGDECEDVPDANRFRLAVARPSRDWVVWAAAAAENAGVERILVITLEVGNYVADQRDWRGRKEVQLGTGYTVDVPWLTALDRPISVLQLTGVVVDRNGLAYRIGAEGLFARRTNVLLGGFGVQALISDADVEHVRGLRRHDLSGQPLVWQVALAHLVAQLTGAQVAAGG
jgi:hypothetical protein